MDKAKIFYRYKNDEKKFKTDCVDLVIMAQLLYGDLIQRYGGLTMDEVAFAFEQGIRESESGGFVNVRSMNIWLKEYKTKANLMRSQKRLTDYQRYEENVKQIGTTINKAKRIKQ